MDDSAVTVPLKTRNADLPVRVASAAVMLAVALAALWAGGLVLDVFIALVVVAAFAEFVRLLLRASEGWMDRVLGLVSGAIYMGLAGLLLIAFPTELIIGIVGAVICVDSFAYFFGRTLGGPKIAPRISPSKTWAGLVGGIVGATLWTGTLAYLASRALNGNAATRFEFADLFPTLGIGIAVAVVAQAGDFFESWLKRRAGVKDSSNLIPGHGGVFDRIDGMIPVVLLAGAVFGAGL